MSTNFIVLILFFWFASLIQVGWCQQDTCPIVTAPDGSQYDISSIAYKVHQYIQNSSGVVYTYKISICAPLSSPCGGCSTLNSAGVCQIWGQTTGSSKCFGNFSTAQLVGLNNGAGVQITYQGGDPCGSCDPAGPRSSVITLQCSNNVPDPSQIVWTGITLADSKQAPITYFYGNISCPMKHVTIEYIGYGTGCNGTDAYLVTANNTRTCKIGCQLLGNRYIYTDCDTTVRLPSGTWIEQITYNELNCNTPKSAVFSRSDQCSGTFQYSYQDCDPNTVYTYSCSNPFCNQCTTSSKIPTNTCNEGTRYQCASKKLTRS